MPDCEINEGSWNKVAMRFVFTYLNETEQRNAYLVCKSWKEIGKSLNEKKCPSCKIITKSQNEIYPNFAYSIKNTVQYLVKNPSFCMFIINDALKFNHSESCYCELLKSNCYFILLRTPFPKNEIITLSSTIFPNLPNIQINHYTFYATFIKDEYYCPEIRNYFDYNCIECDHLKEYFDPIIQNESASKCLILWCKKSSLKQLTNLIKNMADWYPTNEMIVWGGVVETLTICNRNADLPSCWKNIDFAFFFINDQTMKIESLFLDQNYTDKDLIEEKFINLKEKTMSKKDSIAFMYTSYFRLDDFYELKTSLFRKYFPNVKLIHAIGREPFGETGFVELFKRLKKTRSTENTIHSALMILTYN